ncbi:hypothetical protein VTL71DRAFT_12696 [Oculimacula yallundae]|uniref:Heterokaryon incompatibility domain-containing protein n=1 Tax=Oculimacula yallundae TaxID=86028 RepID=A0ABR4CQH3_9HELO
MICSKCQEIFDTRLRVSSWLQPTEKFHHYQDIESFRRAAKSCQICAHTLYVMQSTQELDQEGILDVSCNLESECPEEWINLKISANRKRVAMFKLIPGYVRLVHRRSQQLAAHYATLSHRWNSETPQMLPSDSDLMCLEEGILIKNMTSVFQEAIAVAYRLGIHYIWIDSLCIIQGASPEAQEDWQNESSKMGEVYKNAYLNIFATGTGSFQGGLFADRDPDKMDLSPRLVNWVTEEGQRLTGHYTLDYDEQSRRIVGRELGSHTYSRLLNRGWVFQERFLGPRLVHFGAEEIIFECRDSIKCEGTDHTSVSFVSSRRLFMPIQKGNEMTSQPGTQTWGINCGYSHHWLNTVVEKYSACEFTYESDRLVALSGIAKEFALMCGIFNLAYNYLAGHWRDSLPFSLLWYMEDPSIGSKEFDPELLSGRAIKEDISRTPSWSWLSAHSKLAELGTTRLHRSFKSHANLVSAHMDLMSPDPTGQIRVGRLKLEVSLTRLSGATIVTTLAPESTRVAVIWKSVVCEQCPDLPCKLDTMHVSSLKGDYWCIPVMTSGGFVKGLLLQRIWGQHSDYRRVGIFRLSCGKQDVSFLFHDTEEVVLV